MPTEHRTPLAIDSPRADLAARDRVPFGASGAKSSANVTDRRPRMAVSSSAYATTAIPDLEPAAVQPTAPVVQTCSPAAIETQRLEPVTQNPPATPALNAADESKAGEAPAAASANDELAEASSESPTVAAEAVNSVPARPARKRFRRVGPTATA